MTAWTTSKTQWRTVAPFAPRVLCTTIGHLGVYGGLVASDNVVLLDMDVVHFDLIVMANLSCCSVASSNMQVSMDCYKEQIVHIINN